MPALPMVATRQDYTANPFCRVATISGILESWRSNAKVISVQQRVVTEEQKQHIDATAAEGFTHPHKVIPFLLLPKDTRKNTCNITKPTRKIQDCEAQTSSTHFQNGRTATANVSNSTCAVCITCLLYAFLCINPEPHLSTTCAAYNACVDLYTCMTKLPPEQKPLENLKISGILSSHLRAINCRTSLPRGST